MGQTEEAMDIQSESRFVNTMVYLKLALTQCVVH